MKKLPVEFKAKWVEALRSGKYKQCHSYLTDYLVDDEGHDTDEVGFCCLGVAAVSLGIEELGSATELTSLQEVDEDIKDVLSQLFVGPTDVEGQLIKMNDNLGVSFTGIADWIEENL